MKMLMEKNVQHRQMIIKRWGIDKRVKIYACWVVSCRRTNIKDFLEK